MASHFIPSEHNKDYIQHPKLQLREFENHDKIITKFNSLIIERTELVYSLGRKIFFVGPTFIVVMVLLFFVFSDPNNDTQEIQKAIQESIMESNTHVEKVVHIEKVENVTLAFYATPKGLAVGRLEQTFRGVIWGNQHNRFLFITVLFRIQIYNVWKLTRNTKQKLLLHTKTIKFGP